MSRIATVSYASLRVGMLWVVLGGCAQGFEGPQAFGFDLPGSGSSQGGGQKPGNSAGGGGSTPIGGAAGGMAGMNAGGYDGDPCLRGEIEACACAGGGMGTRSCAFDASSPTEGSFGECGHCSGGGGAGGNGGAGGMGGAGSGAAGSGGSGAAGSGGGSAPPPPSSGSKPGWCVFVPVPLPGVC